MDNLTHTLVGVAVAKAGLERVSPYATAMCMVAANAPDVDVVSRLGGTWFALQHHRGITHSIIGTLTLGLLLPLAFFVVEKISARVGRTPTRIRLRGLVLASVLACATHPLLDWLNSYGVRPLLPWDGRWFYGDILFILDPWLWLVLGGAAFLLTARTRWRVGAWGALALVLTAAVVFVSRRALPALSVVVSAAWLVGVALIVLAWRARLPERYGAWVARAALALVVLYCGALSLLHARALARARADAGLLAARRGETVLRVAAMPMPADPTDWLSVAETERATYHFPTRLPASAPPDESEIARFAKPEAETAAEVARAEQDARAGVFLNFARFPVISVEPARPGEASVRFADLRFGPPGRARTPGRGFTLEVLVPRARP